MDPLFKSGLLPRSAPYSQHLRFEDRFEERMDRLPYIVNSAPSLTDGLMLGLLVGEPIAQRIKQCWDKSGFIT